MNKVIYTQLFTAFTQAFLQAPSRHSLFKRTKQHMHMLERSEGEHQYFKIKFPFQSYIVYFYVKVVIQR